MMPVPNVAQSYSPKHSKSTPDNTPPEKEEEIETEETEEEISEDNESESEGSEGEDSEGGESEGEEEESSDNNAEEDESEQILDLKNVPPPLRAAAKKMLATHTKTQQKYKKQYEEAVTTLEQDLQEKYSEAVVKAAGWDKLTRIPEFNDWWEAFSTGNLGTKKGRNNSSEEEDSLADGEEKNKGLSEERIVQLITKVVRAEINPLKTEKANDLWSQAEEKLPNFKKYKAAVTSYLTKHPTLSIQEAYDFVTSKDREKEAVQKALDEAKKTTKKIPRTLKPGSSGGSSIDHSTIKSLDDAIGAARRKLVG